MNVQIQIEANQTVLLCRCGGNYLHHGAVQFDCESVLIAFECEICGKHSTLSVNQHKGQTILEWEASSD
ncbi:MAG: hypothetical protein KGI50_06340 [Patescibacteria group bacterium]|nr:hypothetical protein [Patescibacteria group bacterium]